MTDWLRRLRYLVQRDRLERELADEMAFHAEMAARDGGRPFGNALRLREEARDAWGWTWIDRCAQDVRYAARVLRRSPGFTIAAVLTLAVGIGVNVAAFGLVNLVLLKPLPVADPDTLLRFVRRSPQQYASLLPYPEVAYLRDHARTLSAVIAVHSTKLAIDDGATAVRTDFVTPNFFRELGASPRLGRLLDPAGDAAPDADPVAVLSQGFWERHLGADPQAVGRRLRLNGEVVTVIGVVPREFSGLRLADTDAWLPIGQHPRLVRGSRLLTDFSWEAPGVSMWGRLRPGVAAPAAEEELAALVGVLRQQHPEDIWEGERLHGRPADEARSGSGSSRGTGTKRPDDALPVLAVAGTLSLLILAVACANLGGLLLARGVAREREIAIRVAIGAGRRRLIRQLFTESLLLAAMGAAAGVALGHATLVAVMRASEAPAWLDPTPDWRVLAFAGAAAVVAAVLFGLAPAFQAVRRRRSGTLLRQTLVAAQVAASCVLLIVAGLLVRALDRAMTADPGFDYEHLLAVDPSLAAHGYSLGAAQAYFDTVEGRLAALPGITAVSYATMPPLSGRTGVTHLVVDGRPLDVHVNRVDPRFFQTMGIPLVRGRNLVRGEDGTVVVSESMALARWRGEDPLGRQFDGRTVVGIVANARTAALQDPEAVEAYFAARPADMPSMVMLVRASGPPKGLAPFVASIARSADQAIFPEVTLLGTSYSQRIRQAEMTAAGVALLGGSALLLACLGIVGLVAYSVSQRTKEIGIRMALGARATQVLSAVLGQLTRPVVLGLAAGVVGAALVAQLLRRELYGVSHLDPVAYAAAICVFSLAVVLAALGPARRALRVDPLMALRDE